jgi:hypothetical protein
VRKLPAALAALQAANNVHETAHTRRAERPEVLVEVEDDSVMLRHLAVPFDDLLRLSGKAGKDVAWGV